jgi:hypothetical protein
MIEGKFYDRWGRELEAQTCEYCGSFLFIAAFRGDYLNSSKLPNTAFSLLKVAKQR